MSTLKHLDVAKNERGVRVRRSDRKRRQRFGRPFVSAENFRAQEFAGAVEARDTLPHRVARRQLCNITSAEMMCLFNGVEYRAIPGAAAQHAGERVLDRLLAGPDFPSQQRDRGSKDTWRANAALRSAMGVQSRAQLRTIASSSLRPSIVSIERPSVCPTAVKQAHTASPSISTVQAPQSPASQPTLTPVSPHCSRRT
jgi:hypothetical protein